MKHSRLPIFLFMNNYPSCLGIFCIFLILLSMNKKNENITFFVKELKGYELKVRMKCVKSKNSYEPVEIICAFRPKDNMNTEEALRVDSCLRSNHEYMSFNFQNHLYFISDTKVDTIRPSLFLYEGDHGLGREFKSILYFESRDIVTQNRFLDFVIEDRLINNEVITFKVDIKDLL